MSDLTFAIWATESAMYRENRWVRWYVLAVLMILVVLAVGRGLQLAGRSVHVFAVDRSRSVVEGLADLVFVLCFIVWFYELFAWSLDLGFHVVPAALRTELFAGALVGFVGAAVMTAGIVVYALALHAFGDSWRLGIDRNSPGTFVTDGIFSRSRNPVYVGLILLAFGSFLATAVVLFLILTLVFGAYFHFLILREEVSLAELYGDAYARYRARVARYWTLRR